MEEERKSLLGPMVLECGFMAIRTGNMLADSRHGLKQLLRASILIHMQKANRELRYNGLSF